MRFANGEIYSGYYKNGMCHGNGIECTKDLKIYSGEWRENEKDGKGRKSFSDGTIYEGEFKNGMFHG